MVFTFPSATSALLGSTAIGIQTSEGVCLAVEKRITSPLMEPSSIEKIVEIDSHIGCAMSGLIADAKTLIDKARVETQNHWFTYNETMTVESVTQAVSNLALQFGEEDADPGAMSRPFGVALLFGGVDEKGPQLFHMDPSGTFVQCDARAIGSASEGAQSSLQEVYHKSMTLKEAIKSSLVILKQVMEEKLNATNIEAMRCQTFENRVVLTLLLLFSHSCPLSSGARFPHSLQVCTPLFLLTAAAGGSPDVLNCLHQNGKEPRAPSK
uniref:Proteasome 20S subunit alpha 5 n=1 Tax=Meleagris gallopavo TaxID=9103 RepID=A0A803YRC6_MELGA